MHRLIIYRSFEVAGRPATELRMTRRRAKQSLNACGPIARSTCQTGQTCNIRVFRHSVQNILAAYGTLPISGRPPALAEVHVDVRVRTEPLLIWCRQYIHCFCNATPGLAVQKRNAVGTFNYTTVHGPISGGRPADSFPSAARPIISVPEGSRDQK